MKWIKDKEHCWYCKRTRQQVLDDVAPMGDVFDCSSDKTLLSSAFLENGMDIGCYKIPICVVCKTIIESLALDVAEDSFICNIENLTLETKIR